jgi:non-canonical poly(A) RNA polymerase PAPD5/7
VPIIKFVFTKYKLHFDLSVNKLDGLYQLKEVEKAIDFYPELKYLLIVNKCILKQRDLN